MTTRMSLVTFLTMLMLNTWVLAINQAEATSPVNVDFKQTLSSTITVPEDYPTIQEAVKAANPRDTVFVYNGTYKEHVIVDKTLTLTGQDKSTTIVDGNGTGTPLTITAPNVTVTGFTIKSGPTQPPNFPLSGIHINSTGNTISDNVITKNDFYAIGLTHHGKNTIKQNIIANNTIGIFLLNSDNNTIYHNNLINNLEHAETHSSHNNTWDNGYPSGGNHWSNHTREDRYSGPYQNETGIDLISDNPYPIDQNNQDQYPLTEPWSPEPTKTFTIKFENKTYHIHTESNSTITHFQFNHTQKQISFNVTGPPDTTGYCNTTIPKNLLRNNPWTTKIDNKTATDYIQTENHTHTSLYFTYELPNTRHIIIKGTWVIPEFPTAIIPPIFMIVTLIVIILTTRTKLPRETSMERLERKHPSSNS